MSRRQRERRGPVEPVKQISLREINDMFCYIVHCPAVTELAAEQLRPEHFDQDREPHMGLLWAVMRTTWRQTKRLPFRTIQRELLATLDDSGEETLTPAQNKALRDGELLRWMFVEARDEELNVEDGLALLREFLLDRAVLTPLESAVSSGGIRQDFSTLLQDLSASAERVRNIGVSSLYSIFPPTWQRLTREGAHIGVAVFDRFMTEGDAPGECYGILGPTGGGKTMALVDIAVSRALQYADMPPNGDDTRRPVVVYASYEEPRVQMRARMLARGANIHKTRLERMISYDDLSRRGALQDYELELARRDGVDAANMGGEFDRLQAVAPVLANSLFVLDMTGDELSKGNGGVAELRAELLDFERKNPTCRIGTVLVDYAGLMLSRQLVAQDKDFGELRHYLRLLGTELKTQIGQHFDCSVWIAHQFSGEANKRSSTARMHHADAAEGKSFADGLVYCFGLGTPEEDTKLAVLHCTKDRRTGHNGQRTIVQLDGAFQRIKDVSGEYVIDAASQRIVGNRTAAEFGGATHGRRPPVGMGQGAFL